MVARPESPALLIHHDDDAQVYSNGRLVTDLDGHTTVYQLLRLDPEQAGALRAGGNTLAAHCRHSGGGQFIDVHLVSSEAVPELLRRRQIQAHYKSDLTTVWGESVTPENVWKECPRPQSERADWVNLNEGWDYAVTDRDAGAPQEWDGELLVPFALESKLGGVARLLLEDETLWYQ